MFPRTLPIFIRSASARTALCSIKVVVNFAIARKARNGRKRTLPPRTQRSRNGGKHTGVTNHLASLFLPIRRKRKQREYDGPNVILKNTKQVNNVIGKDEERFIIRNILPNIAVIRTIVEQGFVEMAERTALHNGAPSRHVSATYVYAADGTRTLFKKVAVV